MAQVSGYDATLPVRKSEGSNPSVVKNQGSVFVLELLQLSNRTVVGKSIKGFNLPFLPCKSPNESYIFANI